MLQARAQGKGVVKKGESSHQSVCSLQEKITTDSALIQPRLIVTCQSIKWSPVSLHQ